MSIGIAVLVIVVGLFVGVFSALFGVGGGIIMVPVMVLVLGETQHVAVGTSLAVIVPTALVGLIAHRRTGYLSWSKIAILGAGGTIGAVAGARIALFLEGEVLRRAFGLLVVLAGAWMIFQGARRERREEGIT